jgi:TolB-like protein
VLWPGRFKAQAKASLRQCLLALGKVLASIDDKALVVTRTQICLSANAIPTDLFCLEHDLAQGHYGGVSEQLTTIGARPLLDQLSFGEEFKIWLSINSTQIEQRLKTAALLGLSSLQATGTTIEYQRLLDAWQLRCPDTQSGSRRIMKAPKNKIAVLAFSTLEQDNYFAEGMVDEIITMLGQVPALLVAGRSASLGLKNNQRSSVEIAQILGMSHLVEGSVQRQHNEVRINVRLIDGSTGFETWGNSYKGTIEDVFVLQERVAGAVAQGLSCALGLALAIPKYKEMT